MVCSDRLLGAINAIGDVRSKPGLSREARPQPIARAI